MSTPRSHKRKIPVIPTDEDQEEAAPIAAPAPVSPVAPVEPALVVASPSKKVEPENEEDAYTAEEEERARIWDMFAEEYHDIVAELPLEYQRNFFLIQELENTQQGCTSALKTHLQSYLSALTTPTAPASPVASTSAPSYVDEEDGPSPYVRQTLNSIAKAARSAVRAGEDKVGLAVTLYEAVDRHIRRLDADLAKYEDSLVIGLRAGTLPSHDAPSLSLKSPPGRTTSRGAIALGEKDPHGENAPAGGSPKRRGSAMGPEMDGERKRVKELQRMEKRKTDAMGRSMPIDPSEPTYCICGRVSFGDMIGCDNDDCAREWFHYECVGLDRPPLGKWFCTDCVHLAGTAAVDTPPKKSHQKRIR